MKFSTIATIALSLVLTAAPRSVLAQDVAATPVTITAQDAPVRSTLEAFFKQAGIKNYILENGVAGFVTLNLVDQPMESALKLVLRANSIPLTYSKENGVWIVKPRRISSPEAILAHSWEGQLLPLDHGGPVRLVVPHRLLVDQDVDRDVVQDRGQPGRRHDVGVGDVGDVGHDEGHRAHHRRQHRAAA